MPCEEAAQTVGPCSQRFRDEEEDEDDGEEHQGCEEEVDAESHRGEHLRSEASDYLLLAIANPKLE